MLFFPPSSSGRYQVTFPKLSQPTRTSPLFPKWEQKSWADTISKKSNTKHKHHVCEAGDKLTNSPGEDKASGCCHCFCPLPLCPALVCPARTPLCGLRGLFRSPPSLTVRQRGNLIALPHWLLSSLKGNCSHIQRKCSWSQGVLLMADVKANSICLLATRPHFLAIWSRNLFLSHLVLLHTPVEHPINNLSKSLARNITATPDCWLQFHKCVRSEQIK